MNRLVFPILADIKPLTLILIIGGGVLLLVALIVLILVLLHHKKNKPLDSSIWLIALGDKENIKEVSATGSRLSLVLVDKERIDREKLKELGVTSILVMSNKVTLVIEDKAEDIASSIKENL